MAVGPELSIIFQCEHVHLANFHNQILDNMEAVEVDENESADLNLAENHEELEASLSIEVGMLNAE